MERMRTRIKYSFLISNNNFFRFELFIFEGRSFQFSIFHYSDGTARCCTVFLFFYYAVRIGVLFVRKDVQNRDGAVAAAAAEAEAEKRGSGSGSARNRITGADIIIIVFL